MPKDYFGRGFESRRFHAIKKVDIVNINFFLCNFILNMSLKNLYIR